MSADEQPGPFGDASWFDDQFGRDAPKPARGLPPPLRHALVLLGVAAVVAAAALAAGLTRDRHRGDSSPATSTSVEVSSLRVVPPMAGVAVEVNGHRYTSRNDGSIPLDAADRHGRAAIVEPQDISPAVRVAFSAWADGTTVAARSLDNLRGPTVEIGFVVSNRVELRADTVRSGAVSFVSNAGTVTITIGATAFVPATRAVSTAAGMTAEQITYTAETDDGRVVTFVPTPDAEWSVAAP